MSGPSHAAFGGVTGGHLETDGVYSFRLRQLIHGIRSQKHGRGVGLCYGTGVGGVGMKAWLSESSAAGQSHEGVTLVKTQQTGTKCALHSVNTEHTGDPEVIPSTPRTRTAFAMAAQFLGNSLVFCSTLVLLL